jgi:hypothetical protein
MTLQPIIILRGNKGQVQQKDKNQIQQTNRIPQQDKI